MTASATPDFEDAWLVVADVAGWMTDAQARRLWDRAAGVRRGGRIADRPW